MDRCRVRADCHKPLGWSRIKVQGLPARTRSVGLGDLESEAVRCYTIHFKGQTKLDREPRL